MESPSYEMDSTPDDNIPSLREQYANKLVHQIIALRTFRPHPGAWINDRERLPDELGASELITIQRSRCAEFNACSFDVLLVLVRHLISLAYDNYPLERFTPLEEAVFDAAEKDLGWVDYEDWHIKRHLIDLLNADEVPDKRLNVPTYSELIKHPKLRQIFYDNETFRLVNRLFVKWDERAEASEYMSLTSHHPMVKSVNELHVNSQAALSKQISAVFNLRPLVNGGYLQFVSLRPEFLQIRYSVSQPSLPFSELRVLTFPAPRVQAPTGIPTRYRQEPTYHICAVVKLADGVGGMDKVRTYSKKGTEIVPAEIGNFENKELDIMSGKPWSIEENGEYMLYCLRASFASILDCS